MMPTVQQEKPEAGVVSRGSPNVAAGPSPARRRKIFYLLDSLNIGGTETQAVELARRMDPAKYDVTLACLRKQGPLLEKLNGSSVNAYLANPLIPTASVVVVRVATGTET